MTLNNCFTAFTFDIVTFYAFARSFEYMEHPTFEGPFTNAAKALATTLHTMGHFPWLLALLQALPKRVAAALDPNMAAVFAFHGVRFAFRSRSPQGMPPEGADQERAGNRGPDPCHQVGHQRLVQGRGTQDHL